MNRLLFFKLLRKYMLNPLSAKQIVGISAILDAWDASGYTDLRWLAYMLATARHETGHRCYPVSEKGRGRGKPYGRKLKYSGQPYSHPDELYYGRGYVQLTWYENYDRMGRLLKLPLLEQPELALDLEIAARIMVEGMTRGLSLKGDFTGVALDDYFTRSREEWRGARRIINGTDNAGRISLYAQMFYSIIRLSC